MWYMALACSSAILRRCSARISGGTSFGLAWRHKLSWQVANEWPHFGRIFALPRFHAEQSVFQVGDYLVGRGERQPLGRLPPPPGFCKLVQRADGLVSH